VAHHLTVNANRRHLNCAKRAWDRQEPERISPGFHEPVSRKPGPLDQALADDAWQELIQHLSERQRTIITMRLDGFSEKEIAKELGLNGRTIRKELQIVALDCAGRGARGANLIQRFGDN
jgi:DNA-directed RNA polymerase specialized sigma24 family protein